jgi:hypothetical protein
MMLALLPLVWAADCKEGVTLPPATSLATVDWCNFDYGSVWGPLRAGRQEIHEWGMDGGPHDTILSMLLGVQEVELLPDAGKEVWVALREETYIHRASQASTGTRFLLYAWRDGKPALVWTGYAPLAYEVKFVGTNATLWDHGRCVQRLRAEATGLVALGCTP